MAAGPVALPISNWVMTLAACLAALKRLVFCSFHSAAALLQDLAGCPLLYQEKTAGPPREALQEQRAGAA